MTTNYNKVKNEGVEEFIETGADLEHDRWTKWQKYLHEQLIHTDKPNPEMPIGLFNRWTRQIKTKYADLSEREKESDRIEVRKYIPLLSTYAEKVHKATLEDVYEKLDKNYLEYCREHNGLPYCKNCGLDLEELKTLTK